MSINPKILQARWIMQVLNPEELPVAACEALQQGFDGPAVRELAGLVHPAHRDIESLVERAFREMGISERPDRREAFLLVAKDIASSILEGGQDEIAGARLIAREVYDYANVPEALLQMAGWLSEWDDAGDNCDLEYQAVCREEIRKAAKQMSGNLSMLD